MNFANELADTREAVGQIAGWCIIVAMHQELGIGYKRQEQIGRIVEKLTIPASSAVPVIGRVAVMDMMRDVLKKSFKDGKPCQLEMRVPVLRAPRSRKEQQLRMAGDDACTMCWLLWAAGMREACNIGRERLNRVHDEAVANYAQFNQWGHDNGTDYAWEKLRIAAEAAVREDITVVQEKDEPMNPVQVSLNTVEIIERIQKKARYERKLPMKAPLAVPFNVQEVKMVDRMPWEQRLEALRNG